jgi:putative flippase GtrA
MVTSLETFFSRILKEDSFRFVVVGVSAVAIDFTLYMWLVAIDVPTYLSRGISYFITLLYAYFLNTYYAFKIGEITWSLFFRYWSLYGLVLTFNILLNEALLLLFNKEQSAIVVIYLFVTGVSAIMNFFGLKHYVFSKQSGEKFI